MSDNASRGRGRGGYRGGDRGGGGYRGGGGRGGGRGGAPVAIFAQGQPANVDSRLDPRAQDALLQSFKSLTIGAKDTPVRPGWGTVGQPIKLRANFFPVKITTKPLFMYDVKILPDPKNKRVKKRIFEILDKLQPYQQYRQYIAHDYSAKLISAAKLPQPLEFRFAYYDDDEDAPRPESTNYALELHLIEEILPGGLMKYLGGDPAYKDYNILPIVSALNIVLARQPTSAGVPVGQNRFFFPHSVNNLGGGLEAWRGFYSSVRPTFNQLMVNVNVATTAFYKAGNLAQQLREFLDMSYGARPDSFVKGVRVKTVHLGRRRSVKKVGKLTARTHKFYWDEESKEVSVEEYFRKKYKITLRAPDAPLVDVGGQNETWIPPELCEILPGQVFKGKLSDEHTASMIRYACNPPERNAVSITSQGLTSLGFSTNNQILQNFGVSIGGEMAIVPARILKSPTVVYSNTNITIDDRASWNLRDVRFSRGAKMLGWAVLLIQDGNQQSEYRGLQDPDLRDAVRAFASMCRKNGMEVDKADPKLMSAQLPPKRQDTPTRSNAIQAIKTAVTKLPQKPSIILVLLSNGDKHIYSGLKHLCDVQLGVATVCVHSEKFRKSQPQYFANVALKVNMKLGGINHQLDQASMEWLRKEATMMIGMDVTHPGPGSLKGTPSVAAVVGSIDNAFAQFPASLRIQQTKKEMITSLRDMVEERINDFRKYSRTLPKRVLVYRDGVSEGQFNTVIDEELPEIQAAFKKFDTAAAVFRPKLTIVICGKRHHTRFYPTDPSHADHLGNPKPGTVVDQGVTAVYGFDFFLQAHSGLQGTTRPTHYYVVHDEMKFTADQLQRLTNDVSFMFARATKAVSLASPAYYADLACERGRCYIHELLNSVESLTSTTADDVVMKQAERLWSNGVHNHLKHTMFYL